MDFNQTHSDQAKRFQSHHWVHTRTADNKELVTITGVAIIDFKGSGPEWRKERLNLTIKFPYSFFPANKWLQVEHWAPFITLNAIANEKTAINAGWAVERFGVDFGRSDKKIKDTISLWADIAIRDIDGYLWRVGYSVTVSGKFTEPPQLPYPE